MDSFLFLFFLIFALIFSPLTPVIGEEVCGRIAIINFQEVLVDSNSNQKGEGLRYYLEKDHQSKVFFDSYQKGNEQKWLSAALGTVSSLMILTGFLTRNNPTNRQALIVGGASLMTVNFLVAKTLDYVNKNNLTKSVDEYNKRNLPRIYFNTKNYTQESDGLNIFLKKTWEF